MWRIIFWLLLIVFPVIAKGDPSFDHQPQLLQDPKTKIIYYVESDRRHVAAISPDGKLLWCSQVLHPPKNDFEETVHIDSISSKNDDFLSVDIMFGGKGFKGTINKKTGAFKIEPTIIL